MSTSDFEAPQRELKAHAASGFVFSSAAQITRLITQFLTLFITARLLGPTDFGLIAMVYPIYGFALIFQNLGINQAIIQRPTITHEQLNSFFWINVGLGAGICLILTALSPLVAVFYHESRVTGLTVAMAVLVFIGGLGNIHGALMVRRLQFRLQTSLNIAAAIASLVATVVLAIVFKSVWALYSGLLVSTLLTFLGSWVLVQWRPSGPKLASDTPELMRFGLGVAVANLANIAATSVTSAVIGHNFGARITGLYDRASRLVSSPLQQIAAPVNQVTGPILYRLHDDEPRYVRTFLRMSALLVFILVPFITWTVAMPDTIIRVLMGRRWLEATPLFVALSLMVLPQFINGVVGWIFVTQGRPGDNARWGAFNASVTIVTVLASAPFGVLAVAVSLACSEFIRLPLITLYACRIGPVKIHHVAGILFPRLLGGLAAYVCLSLLHMSGLNAILMLPLGLAISYAIGAAVVGLFPAGRQSLIADAGFVLFTGRQIWERAGKPLMASRSS